MSGALRILSLAVGDELLDGRVADANTRDLGDALSQLGLELAGSMAWRRLLSGMGMSRPENMASMRAKVSA